MTELQLYKFVNERSIEWHKYNDNIILMVDFEYLNDFMSIVEPTLFDDGGLTVIMKHGYIVFDDMNYICDYYGIDPDNIFTGEEY